MSHLIHDSMYRDRQLPLGTSCSHIFDPFGARLISFDLLYHPRADLGVTFSRHD